MLVGPWQRVFRIKSNDRHPLFSLSSNTSTSIDFWGPCAVISAYVAILWLGSVRNGPWAFVIWTIPSVLNHLIMRVCTKSQLLQHMAIIGYSVAPMIPCAGFILLFHPPVWIATGIEVIAVSWAAAAAILTYIATLIVPPEQKHRLSLLFPTLILTELYFISLLPIRFYVYHKHVALVHTMMPTGFPSAMPSQHKL
jgi:hypothetical protein